MQTVVERAFLERDEALFWAVLLIPQARIAESLCPSSKPINECVTRSTEFKWDRCISKTRPDYLGAGINNE